MTKKKFVIFFKLLSVVHFVGAGNYFPCPSNPCLNGGQCILMSPSPSPIPVPETSHSDQNFKSVQAYTISPNALTIEEAREFCHESYGYMLTEDNLNAIPRSAKGLSIWVDSLKSLQKCLVVRKSQQRIEQVPCDQKHYAVCVSNSRQLDLPLDLADVTPYLELPDFIYSCQCKSGKGYENCTDVSNEGEWNPGVTICQNDASNPLLTLYDTNQDKSLFIDHVVYGKPFYLNDSLTGPSNRQCSDFYAKSENDFCVGTNTLAAITYWCQGKYRCEVPLSLLTSVDIYKDFFLIETDTLKTYEDAIQACQDKKGEIAEPSTEEDFRKIQKELSNKNQAISWYWVDSSVEEATTVGIIWHGANKEPGDCLAISNHFGNPYDEYDENNGRFFINLDAIDCQGSSNPPSGVVCQATFGVGPTSTNNPKYNNPSDLTCLEQVDVKVLEFRYHLDVLDSTDVSCSMDVDSRRNNTCYKYTEVMTWREARRQCWAWGGDLAFPLDEDSNDCQLPIVTYDANETWLAGATGCVNDNRCIVSFGNTTAFNEGTYFTSNDLCYVDVHNDTGCGDSSGCNSLRRGICALPPTKERRTHFPSGTTCNPVSEDTNPDWPYGNYTWDQSGIPGRVSYQNCPEGQSGTASWLCGYDGNWINSPNLLNCTSLDIDDTLDALEQPDSVPSEVVSTFYDDVSSEEQLASGDIDSVLIVLDRAIEVQNERLPEQEDPNSYAEIFTSESLNLLDDILRRPVPWLGIQLSDKQQRLTAVQAEVDRVAQSLITYSSNEVSDFISVNEVVKLTVRIDQDLKQGEIYNDGSSSILVRSQNASEDIRSVSFKSFSSFSCILAELSSCDEVELPVDNFVNSLVMGASLFNKNNRQLEPDLIVDLNFQYTFNRESYNTSDEPSCVFWNETLNDWSEEGCTLISSDDPYAAHCQCNHLTNFAVILDINGNLEDNTQLNNILTWVTLVGCTLSIISLVICLYVFTFVKGLAGERTTIHRNLCISLLFAEILLLSGLNATDNYGLCATIAGFLHFLFLSVFAWMLVEGVHVYYMLVKVKHHLEKNSYGGNKKFNFLSVNFCNIFPPGYLIKVDQCYKRSVLFNIVLGKVFDTARSPLWMYYLVGYALPAVIVIICVVIVEATGTHGYGTDTYCWLDYKNGLIWAFAAPALLVVLVNTFMFVRALMIARKTMKKRVKSTDKNTLTLLKGSFSLVCILGLTWAFGFTYFADGAEWMAIIFTILNSLQGVFILLFHVIMNEKARKEVKKTLRRQFKIVKATVSGDTYETTTTGKDTDVSRSHARYSNGTMTGATLSTDVGGGDTSVTENGEELKYYRGDNNASRCSSQENTSIESPKEEKDRPETNDSNNNE